MNRFNLSGLAGLIFAGVFLVGCQSNDTQVKVVDDTYEVTQTVFSSQYILADLEDNLIELNRRDGIQQTSGLYSVSSEDNKMKYTPVGDYKESLRLLEGGVIGIDKGYNILCYAVTNSGVTYVFTANQDGTVVMSKA